MSSASVPGEAGVLGPLKTLVMPAKKELRAERLASARCEKVSRDDSVMWLRDSREDLTEDFIAFFNTFSLFRACRSSSALNFPI